MLGGMAAADSAVLIGLILQSQFIDARLMSEVACPGKAESQLRDYQARLGKPFPHDTYLAELTGLRDQLKAGLSATALSSLFSAPLVEPTPVVYNRSGIADI